MLRPLEPRPPGSSSRSTERAAAEAATGERQRPHDVGLPALKPQLITSSAQTPGRPGAARLHGNCSADAAGLWPSTPRPPTSTPSAPQLVGLGFCWGEALTTHLAYIPIGHSGSRRQQPGLAALAETVLDRPRPLAGQSATQRKCSAERQIRPAGCCCAMALELNGVADRHPAGRLSARRLSSPQPGLELNWRKRQLRLPAPPAFSDLVGKRADLCRCAASKPASPVLRHGRAPHLPLSD